MQKEKKSVDQSGLNEKINTAKKKKIKTLVTKAELKTEQNKTFDLSYFCGQVILKTMTLKHI